MTDTESRVDTTTGAVTLRLLAVIDGESESDEAPVGEPVGGNGREDEESVTD